jgi:DNA-binding IclR family transcriptional regulator
MPENQSAHVSRTLKTLELLATEPRTAPQLADELGVHPRTVRRLLGRLLDEGYVVQDGHGRAYSLTLKVVALAGRVVERTDLVRVAFPYVVRLRNETGEAAHLCVPREDGVMHLVQESGESIVSVSSRVGEVVPYASTAVGKALLAHRTEHWKALFERGLPQLTEHTITEPADLLVELQRIRERGFAIDDRESDLELRCCAAAVFDQRGHAVAAIGVSAPSSRLGCDLLPDLGVTVLTVARSLSAALGHDTRDPAATQIAALP